MLLTIASVTDSLVRVATHLISSLGLGGVALMTLSSGVIGVPGTEPTMLFAGFDVFQGDLTLPGIIIAGVVGDVAGATIAYSIGYFGQHELIERQGGKLHVSEARLSRAHQWFDRYGAITIFVSRLLPLIRAVFPYAAGVSRMPYWRFVSLAALGSIIWITGLGLLGRAVGSSWPSWRHHLEYVDYAALALLLLTIAYVVLRRNRNDRGGPTADALSD